MRRLLQFYSLNRHDRVLFLKALALLWIIRIGLWILSYKRMKPLVDRWKKQKIDDAGFSHQDAPADAEEHRALYASRVGWAVKAASRSLPGDHTCLVQALSVEVFLGRRGIPAALKIGVFKDEGLGLQAHAWVESEGVVVIGGIGIERCELLTPSLDAPGYPEDETR